MRQHLKASKGITLIELVVAAAVMAATITALLGTYVTVETLNARSRNLTIATQVVTQKIETYRNTPYNAIGVGSFDFSSSLSPYSTLGSPRSATAIVSEVQAGSLKQIDVEVSYTQANKPKKVQVTTYVAARGINR